MVTYDCIDCGIEVTNVSTSLAPDPPLCLTCRFVRDVPEEEREAVRKFLNR